MRTDSPDNDSGFSDNASLLSSGSSLSASGSSSGSSTASTTNNGRHNIVGLNSKSCIQSSSMDGPAQPNSMPHLSNHVLHPNDVSL